MGKLYNPTGKPISFWFDGKEYTVGAKEDRELPAEVVDHCIRHINNPLVEVEKAEPEKKAPIDTSGATIDYSKLSWNELRQLAREKGFYHSSITKKEVIATLEGEQN